MLRNTRLGPAQPAGLVDNRNGNPNPLGDPETETSGNNKNKKQSSALRVPGSS